MTDHHDDFGHFDDHHDPMPLDDTPGHDDTPIFDHDDHEVWEHDEPRYEIDDPQPAPDHEIADLSEVGVHEDVAAIPEDDHVDVFPPTLDVGELPEPVDGFPWIDTGSLGVADPANTFEHVDPVRPEELAEYAGEQLPPGADPWAALADSDDPATSALARWWNEN